MPYDMIPIGGGHFLIIKKDTITTGRKYHKSTGASVSGGVSCGMGSKRK